MPVRPPNTRCSGLPSIKQFLIDGAVAGDLVCTGIKAHDALLAVTGIKDGGGTPLNLLSEFTITAADTINNTGGTSTAGYDVLVLWWAAPTQL